MYIFVYVYIYRYAIWIPFGDHPLKLERYRKISMAPAQG